MLKALEKLKRQLAEAEAELESRKKPSEDTGPKFVGEGLVIDEWVSFLQILYIAVFVLPFPIDPYLLLKFMYIQKERRERYLARQQVEGVDSL